MKHFLIAPRALLVSFAILVSVNIVKAQTPTYQLYFTNVSTTTTTVTWDAYLLRTGATPLELATIQFGFGYDISILNGGTLSASIIPGFSELPAGMQPTAITSGAVNYTGAPVPAGQTDRYINVAAKSPPGAGSGPIITNVSGGCSAPGVRIGRFMVTNSAPFLPGSHFNQVFSTSLNTQKTKTQVNAYVSGSNTNITVDANHFSYNVAGTCDPNPALNSCTVTAGITNNTGTTVLTCTTTTINVTATGGVSYAWDHGLGNNANAAITAPGTYTVTVTAAGGCTDTKSITVTQDITPPIAGITNNSGRTELNCLLTSISVTATGGVSYSWDGGATPGTANNSFSSPGTYTVTVTGANGCTSQAQIVITQDITPPTAGITNNSGSTVLTCTLTSISVTATGGVSYLWDGGATPNTAANSFSASGTYHVTVTGVNGCTSQAQITITQNITTPTAGITNNSGSTVLTCSLASISVTATGGGTYSWSGGLGNSANATITAPGTYTVTVTGANGCTSTAQIIITQDITTPTAGITNNTGTTILTCTTTSISVTATGGGTYSWSGGLGNIANATITAPGTYTVTVTGANGCTSTAQIIITQDITTPTAGITNNSGSTVLTCSLTSISVTATGGGTYSWSGGLGNSANATITAPGTYTVTVTGANGCTSTAQIIITQDITTPTAGITNNSGSTVLTCSLTSISVTATGGGTYSWSGGLGNSANATITAPGTYTVTVTGANGCTSTAQIIITQDITTPTAGITNNSGSTVLTCSLTTISVTATGGGTYSWSGGLGNSANATITAPGTYTVTVTGANGCTSTAQIIITQNITTPTAGITNNTGTTILTCTTTSISVTATGGGTYSWSGGLGNSANATITAPGTYTVTVTGANGCTSTAQIIITQDITTPTAGITNNTGTTILTCTTTSISVAATGGGTYSWSGGLGNSANATITAPGTYTVTVTGANGCTSTAQIVITQNITTPTAGITNNSGSTVLTCSLTSISVTATGGVSYLWDGGATPNTAANSFGSPGTYNVTVTGANGCTGTAQIVITQNITTPTAGITNNTGTTILTCTTTSISVTATGGGTYSWSGGLGNSANATITAPGTYTVTVTGANGCTSTAQIVITQNITTPTAGITNNTGTTILTCTTASISVTATGGGTYSWSGGLGNSANATITAPGTYTVTVTGANGCTSTAQIIITQNITTPTAGITNNTGTTILTCTTTSISVTATGGGTYSWSGGLGNSANASITAPGTYTVTVTGANGCTSTAQIVITQNITTPTAGITNNSGSTVLTCSLTSISVTATGGVSYLWDGGATPNTATNSFSSPGTYNVTVTGANGCTSQAQIVITQNITTPTAGITNNTGTTILTCTTTSISVTATGGGTYSWSGGLGNSANAIITAPGTYTVTVTGANGCTSTAQITITQNITTPTAGITNNTGTTILTCTTTSISVTATGGGTYSWSGGLGNSANATITAPGTYTVTVTGANGCISTAQIVITQNITTPTAGITNNTGTTILTCTTTSISVTATGGGTYSWSGGLGNSANATITAPGTYTVTVTGANGCTSTAQIIITQNITTPTAGITNNTGTTILTCTTTSISVTATGGGTYSWSGGLGNSANATITAPGTYTVTVTGANGCTSTAQIIITQNITTPTAGITNNTGTTILTCTTTSISVTATGGGTYSWSGGLGNSANASITAPGTYTVTATGANGCTSTAQIIITQNITTPTAGITNNTGTTILTCTTTSISVTATGGGTYSWSGGLGNSANATITAPGTYTVTVTGANGCTSTAQIIITQNITTPTAGITNNTGTTILTCTTTSISVTATGGGTYSWSGGLGNSANATITAPGTYTVTVTGANGCTSTAQIIITQNITTPTAGITNNSGSTVLTCSLTSISVTATGGGTYSWSGGLGNSANATITAPGTYTVTVTGANGCTSTAQIVITQNITTPTAGITNNSGSTVLTCSLTSISVTATGGGTYSWSGGATPGTAANSFNAPGTYTVTVTGANGCTSTAQITITQNITTPTAGITNNSGSTVLTCSLTSISVTATGGGTYSWSGGATPGTAANSFNAPGTYTVTVTGANGCTNTAQITITQNITTPTAGITNNSGSTVLTCSLASISVTATGGVSYSWNGGSTPATAANSFNAPGTYTVTVTGANGCTSTAQITITQNITTPTAGITNNTGSTVLTCSLTSISVTATGGGTYSWNGGATPGTAANSFNAPGTYTVTVTGANGCTSTAQIVITQNITTPTAGITNNSGSTVLTCSLTSISVTATGGGIYSWNGGATPGTAANSFNAPGTYTVMVTGANGCTSTAQIIITQNITTPTAGITNNSGSTVLTCSLSSISVTATGGVSYSWSGGSTPGTAANSFNAPGTYTVTVTGANGCTSTAQITITQNITIPTAGIINNTGTTVLDCTTTSISVTATGGAGYLWSGGATPNTASNSFISPGTYTVTVTGANGCTSQAQITITQNATGVIAGITNNTGTTVLTCTTTSISVTATGGVGYSWSGGLGNSANATITAPGTYTITVTGSNGCQAQAQITITQTVSIPTAGITNNSGTTLLNCLTTSIDVTATGGVSYSWDGGATPNTAANSFTAPGTYTVTVTGASGCTNTASITITQNIAPPVITVINNTGTTVLSCAVSSISLTVTGGSSYSWNNGLGNGSNKTISSPGTYIVTATGTNGCISQQSIIITQSSLPTTTPGPLSGPVNVCQYVGTATQVTYSVPAIPGATSYTWTVPPTVTIVSGQGTNSINVTFAAGFTAGSNKILKVKALTSTCGTSPQASFSLLAQLPNTPAAFITMPPTSNVCPIIGTTNTYTFTINAVAGASSYIWAAQAGTVTINHPYTLANDTTVYVSFTNGFTASAITVQAVNSCGTSNARSFSLTRTNLTVQPSPISGPGNSCEYIAPGGIAAKYWTVLNGATSYTWTLPPGALNITITGVAGDTISFRYPPGFNNGQISVTGSNGCGTSPARVLLINKNYPSAPVQNPDIIQLTPCPNRQYSYTYSALPAQSSSLLWSVPSGATLDSGQGTVRIYVSYPATAVNGNITIQALSNCGSSGSKVLPVKLAACPPPDPRPFARSMAVDQVNTIAKAMEVKVFPNPSVSDFQVQVITAGKESIHVTIRDMQGRVVKRLELMPYQTIKIGSDLKAGAYMMEVRQGENMKVTKLFRF